MKTEDKSSWTQGQWNAYVEAGESREDRVNRLGEVPISMRDTARRHVETVFAIRKYHKNVAS